MKSLASCLIVALAYASVLHAESGASQANLRAPSTSESVQQKQDAAPALTVTMTQKERDEKWEFDFMHNKITVDVEVDRCTTIIVGPKAGKEGPMTTHTADCLNCDFRVGKVLFARI